MGFAREASPSSTGTQRVSLKDIADELGISQTAVSFAINDRPGVSAETPGRSLMAKDTAVCEMPNSSAMSFKLTRCVPVDDGDASRANPMNNPPCSHAANTTLQQIISHFGPHVISCVLIPMISTTKTF